jgi:hypothetical protein
VDERATEESRRSRQGRPSAPLKFQLCRTCALRGISCTPFFIPGGSFAISLPCARNGASGPAGALGLHMQMQTYMSLSTGCKDVGGSDRSTVEPEGSAADGNFTATGQPVRSLPRSLRQARSGGLWTGVPEQQMREWLKYVRLVK